jgi:uncharacterized protein YdaU (DUF1376 family)
MLRSLRGTVPVITRMKTRRCEEVRAAAHAHPTKVSDWEGGSGFGRLRSEDNVDAESRCNPSAQLVVANGGVDETIVRQRAERVFTASISIGSSSHRYF